MKKAKKYLIILLLVFIFSLTGCSQNNSKEQVGDLEQKIASEISYIDNELIDIMNRLNNINFSNYRVGATEVSPNEENEMTSGSNKASKENESSDSQGSSGEGGGEDSSQKGEGSSKSSSVSSKKINVTEMVDNPTMIANYDDVNWEELATIIETFTSSWNTIILDLYKININNADIIDFSNNLDNLLIGIKNKDKNASFTSAANLYSFIPKYVDSYTRNSAEKNILNTKWHILNAYLGATMDNWEYTVSEMNLAEQNFTNLLNDSEFSKNKEYNVNKSYVTLKELQNSAKSKDKTLFFIKYKNAMQEIDILKA